MKAAGIIVALACALAGSACLDDFNSTPTPLVNSQLAALQAQIEELEHQLAVCYAGHELERGEEEPYLPTPRGARSLRR